MQSRGALQREGGFTLVEFMIASLIMAIVLGGTVALATQIQQAFQADLDDAAVQQEARFALDWIARELRSAGSDPYNVILPNSLEIQIDPNGGADNNDSIRLQSDAFPADGAIDDVGEDITLALDAANRVITRADLLAADPAAVAMTDAIFMDLAFTPLNDAGAAEADSELVTMVRVAVTAQSRGRNASTGAFTTFTLSTDVRLRVR